MKTLAPLRSVAARVDALNLRERVLLLAGAMALLFVAIDHLALEPVYRYKRELTLDMEAQASRLERLRRELARRDIAADAGSVDPRDALQEDVARLALRLDDRLGRLLAPDRAGDILGQVLAHDGALTLNAIDTRLTALDPIGETRSGVMPLVGLDRYELDVAFEGSYLDTLDYLRALDALPWTFLWSGIDFTVVEFPVARVELRIHALGRAGG